MSRFLEIQDLRVDLDDQPVVDGLSFEIDQPRLALRGVPRELGEALGGVRRPVRGVLRVQGETPTDLLSRGELAYVPRDSLIPPRWSLETYIRWSARLSAQPTPSEQRSENALQQLGLTSLRKEKVAKLSPHVRQAMVLAGAIATGARILVLDEPSVPGETREAQEWLFRALADALREHSWIALVRGADRSLASRADATLSFAGNRLLAEEDRPIAEMRLAVVENLDAFRQALAEKGIEFERQDLYRGIVRGISPREVLLLSRQVNAVVTEMEPSASKESSP